MEKGRRQAKEERDCGGLKRRDGERDRERERERKRGTLARPLNSPKVRFQAVAYYTVPFHLTRSLAGRCERRGSL